VLDETEGCTILLNETERFLVNRTFSEKKLIASSVLYIIHSAVIMSNSTS